MAKMSVTRALAELKRLDDRIARAMGDGTFVSVTVGKEDKRKLLSGNDTVAVATGRIQSTMDSLDSMFKQRSAIKRAIVQSNAVTTVTLGGETLTVAEAIERKKSIVNKRQLVMLMQRQVANANTQVAQQNAKVEAQIETNLATIYGNDKGKVDAGMFEAIAKPQRDQKEAALLDPLGITDRIAALQEDISLVDTELDFTLSEINAKTEIEA